MPDDVLNKIKYLCKTIPKDEWSGILLYKVEGSIKQPKDMVLHLKEIIMMDKGTATYTDYSYNEKKRDNSGYLDRHIDYTNDKEEALEWKIGQIHSHNTMRVFFSPVDMAELHDNSPSHNYYLSFIVNNYMDMIAKVAYIAEVDTTIEADYKALDDEGNEYVIQNSKFTVKKKKLFMHDCDIQSTVEQITVPKEFMDNVADVIKVKSTPVVKNTVVPYQGNKVETSGVYGKSAGFKDHQKAQVNPNVSKNQANREIGFKQSSSEFARDIFKNKISDEDLSGLDYEDEPLDLHEILTMAAFNGGTVNEYHYDIIDTLLELEVFIDNNITPETISNSFMDVYVETYKKFYDEIVDNEGVFEDVAAKVIELLEENEEEYKFLSKTIMSLKYMLNKLEEYGKSTVQ